MRSKRDKFDIVADILENIKDGRNSKSALMKNANLSFSILKKYIDYLEKNGYVEEKDGSYVITDKGIALLDRLNKVRNLEFQLAELINELSKELL
ncbi:winged helix-turn-helix domain-containing protein [Sulfurisphaera ohwakuensis]|uniref:Transcriptional regulator n=1 Tax=Sulfurisphaera ohwakuensis TaxID=69656 RepID=A0A650CGB8_SULOH|nr:winged helix-turn-helix domain-containing protein [Sulfurisphaera ohwakuensis]MBB5254242.1 putative transcriptional regulator [Sulfurisphaera ohwakuensis]QGR16833.1 transcriptional regulator [Sulfurisphaera ohwakuensis]